jgi:hypothetical protein
MHSGILMFIRRYMMFAKLWQQILICAVLVSAGAALIAVGLLAGAVMVVLGLLSGIQIMSARRVVGQPGSDHAADESTLKAPGELN